MTDQELLAAFRRNPNGSWSPLAPVTIGGASLRPGAAFTEGVAFGGINVAAMLNAAAARYPHLVRT